LIAAGALVIAAAVFMLVIQSRMRPQVEQVAGAYIRNLASQAVNRAVTDIITDMGVSYDDLIRFEKDNLGRVTALRTDIVTANRVKAGIHTQALENIGALAASDIRIPLGTLLSGDLVVGRGPKIPIRLVPIGSVDVAFTNEFGAAGINQALHRIMINISTNISVMLPGSYTDQEVLVEVCVAETVIVGAVPDAYATLDRNPMFGG
ncbi:MAG: sporulation protein YunB, partial [Oscillospiraceae bacterium]|nr:sporulation protein YunB [Oscillospiraceae bacterium]